MLNKWLEQWCKAYVYKWLHVERDPPEGWVKYCLYKLYFRWRRPLVALQGLKRGPCRLRVVGHVAIRLDSIDYTHPVTNDFTDYKLKQRIATLQKIESGKTYFSQADLQQIMPSINNIRVLVNRSRYSLCDGHGRIFALKQTHPQAFIEVDVIELDGSKDKTHKPKIGDLRIRRRFAATPVETLQGESIWLQVYYSLERYGIDVTKEYNTSSQWEVLGRVSEKNVGTASLLVDPDPTMRKFAQMLVGIKRGDEMLVTPEEVV